MTLVNSGLQVLAVALNAGEADARQVHGLGHGQAFLQCFPHLGQVLGVEPFGAANVLALGSGQLLAGLGLLQDALAVLLGQRGEDGEHELARRRGRVNAQVQGLEVDAALVKRVD